MSEGNQTQGLGTVNTTEWLDERRRTDRVEVALPVHVCSRDAAGDQFEEVSSTLNACSDGLYFATQRQSYKVGMTLVVTFPYSAATERSVRFFGKVVRIDSLSDGRFGIAVELVTAVLTKKNGAPFPSNAEEKEE